MGKTRFSASDIIIFPITEDDEEELSKFTCGVEFLDDFFHQEMIPCVKYRALIPYKCVLKATNEIVGVFTLANDVIFLEYGDRNDFPIEDSVYQRIFTEQKTCPAVNIGHLAVREGYQSRGLGTLIVDFIRITFTEYRISGCQFITVDALNNARTLRFYTDIVGFEFQSSSTFSGETRRMYLDIFTSPA